MRIQHFRELHVYQAAYAAALRVFALSRGWPAEERFALTDQVRRASRAVCANVAEAWAKRLYPRHFVSKLTDAIAEADEVGVWLDFARDHGYLDAEVHEELCGTYRSVCAGLVRMARRPDEWRLPPSVHDAAEPYHPTT